MMLTIGGLSGTSIVCIIQIFLYMALVCFFSPKRKPDLTERILWTDSVHLTDTSCYLHGPFNFDSQSYIMSTNTYIALRHWEFLVFSCNKLGIVPPIISPLTTSKAKRKKWK